MFGPRATPSSWSGTRATERSEVRPRPGDRARRVGRRRRTIALPDDTQLVRCRWTLSVDSENSSTSCRRRFPRIEPLRGRHLLHHTSNRQWAVKENARARRRGRIAQLVELGATRRRRERGGANSPSSTIGDRGVVAGGASPSSAPRCGARALGDGRVRRLRARGRRHERVQLRVGVVFRLPVEPSGRVSRPWAPRLERLPSSTSRACSRRVRCGGRATAGEGPLVDLGRGGRAASGRACWCARFVEVGQRRQAGERRIPVRVARARPPPRARASRAPAAERPDSRGRGRRAARPPRQLPRDTRASRRVKYCSGSRSRRSGRGRMAATLRRGPFGPAQLDR